MKVPSLKNDPAPLDYVLAQQIRQSIRQRLSAADLQELADAAATLKRYGCWVALLANDAAWHAAGKGHPCSAAEAQAWAGLIWEIEEANSGPVVVTLPGENPAAVAAVISKAPKGQGQGQGPVLPKI